MGCEKGKESTKDDKQKQAPHCIQLKNETSKCLKILSIIYPHGDHNQAFLCKKKNNALWPIIWDISKLFGSSLLLLLLRSSLFVFLSVPFHSVGSIIMASKQHAHFKREHISWIVKYTLINRRFIHRLLLSLSLSHAHSSSSSSSNARTF